jgi:5-methylcytosine-specific restriction protein A
VPTRPLRQCREPGCAVLTNGTRCPAHAARAEGERAQRKVEWRQRHADRLALYGTPEWRRLRAVVLAEEPTCRVCGQPATVVDHITPHLGDLMVFLDRRNLQALCHSCHARLTSKYDGGFGNKKRSKPVT